VLLSSGPPLSGLRFCPFATEYALRGKEPRKLAGAMKKIKRAAVMLARFMA